ncbi:integrase arm-type DNA-binding domain-containing protein [Mesobacterium sp. TK19101]|uniref:Integrase arm-type DNA-binding domain-containing protein n=1 Tax=Mesobacterium hydrothermale TaxID=3111907 RepID=A0ABU6HGF3_9RHOB|nr:integrase arm-type DNA-binding domain-containing protein [Mesobacterium sp. TK19101]MEC3861542.1 integrase arm-type DNA-binding domain-containing protein [Mesobacterium sp. TK19101]
MSTLKAAELPTLAPKKYHDGDGLYFDKKKRGACWLYKYTLNGSAREMGLGSYPEVSLRTAREEATKARALKARGIDPIDERAAVRRRGTTFEKAAREYWQVHCQHYAKPENWINGMELNVFPHIGRKPIASLTAEDLIKFLKPIWGREKTRKLRHWINAVIGYVAFDDPRVDRDLMKLVDNKLGPQNIEYDNLTAVPWADIPKLWQALPPTLVGLSMKVLILTGQRVNPIIRADWSEFDFKEKVWIIPPGRIKRWKLPYRVPLSKTMIEVLREAGRLWGKEGLVFPSPTSKSGRLSNNAHRLWLHKHEWRDEEGELATAHGLRSAFRTWMEDAKPPVEWRLAEHILQHMGSLGNQTEQAYLRTDKLEHRREVMDAWAEFVVSGVKSAQAYQHWQDALDAQAERGGRTLREVEDWARMDADGQKIEAEHLEKLRQDNERRLRDG